MKKSRKKRGVEVPVATMKELAAILVERGFIYDPEYVYEEGDLIVTDVRESYYMVSAAEQPDVLGMFNTAPGYASLLNAPRKPSLEAVRGIGIDIEARVVFTCGHPYTRNLFYIEEHDQEMSGPRSMPLVVKNQEDGLLHVNAWDFNVPEITKIVYEEDSTRSKLLAALRASDRYPDIPIVGSDTHQVTVTPNLSGLVLRISVYNGEVLMMTYNSLECGGDYEGVKHEAILEKYGITAETAVQLADVLLRDSEGVYQERYTAMLYIIDSLYGSRSRFCFKTENGRYVYPTGTVFVGIVGPNGVEAIPDEKSYMEYHNHLHDNFPALKMINPAITRRKLELDANGSFDNNYRWNDGWINLITRVDGRTLNYCVCLSYANLVNYRVWNPQPMTSFLAALGYITSILGPEKRIPMPNIALLPISMTGFSRTVMTRPDDYLVPFLPNTREGQMSMEEYARRVLQAQEISDKYKTDRGHCLIGRPWDLMNFTVLGGNTAQNVYQYYSGIDDIQGGLNSIKELAILKAMAYVHPENQLSKFYLLMTQIDQAWENFIRALQTALKIIVRKFGNTDETPAKYAAWRKKKAAVIEKSYLLRGFYSLIDDFMQLPNRSMLLRKLEERDRALLTAELYAIVGMRAHYALIMKVGLQGNSDPDFTHFLKILRYDFNDKRRYEYSDLHL